MRIVHLVAGAGGMYCGSCMHGNTLAAALRRAGCDAMLVPAYTPLRTDEEYVGVDRVVYGGLNVYLQQSSAVFRRMPRWMGRLLDRPGLLRWVARRGSTTRAADLGPLCVSMLRGEEGRQRAELDKLVDWLADEVRPDAVHLNNAMLVGMARQIDARLGVPVVCDLSGEDSFVEKLPEPYHGQARAILKERCRPLAAMVAMNRYYADFMAGYLDVPRERIHVIPPGLNLDGFPGSSQRDAPETVTVGFLGRVCHDKGLHLLAEAFRLLVEDTSLPPLRLEAAGYLAPGDRGYLREIEAWLRQRGLAEAFCYRGELDRPGKIAYLRSLTVLSAAAVFPEAKGLPVLEAWAAGTPVVAPDRGAFPEMIADTGGGLLHAPDDVGALAEVLGRVIQNPDLAADLARRGHEAAHDHFHAERMARQTIELYESVCKVSTTR